jgi:hypothetical protein
MSTLKFRQRKNFYPKKDDKGEVQLEDEMMLEDDKQIGIETTRGSTTFHFGTHGTIVYDREPVTAFVLVLSPGQTVIFRGIFLLYSYYYF